MRPGVWAYGIEQVFNSSDPGFTVKNNFSIFNFFNFYFTSHCLEVYVKKN